MKAAVAGIRSSATANAEPNGEVNSQDQHLRKVVSAAAMPRIGHAGTIYDVLERRTNALTAKIKAMPDTRERKAEANDLYERAGCDRFRLDRIPAGIRRAAYMMDTLNMFGMDVDDTNKYIGDH